MNSCHPDLATDQFQKMSPLSLPAYVMTRWLMDFWLLDLVMDLVMDQVQKTIPLSLPASLMINLFPLSLPASLMISCLVNHWLLDLLKN
jgi:hypothetical protein